MAERGPLAKRFSEFADDLFVGDGTGKAELFSQDVVWESAAGRIEGRDSLISTLVALRESTGWTKHEIIETSEADGHMTFLSRNHLADGVKLTIGGVMKADENGQIIEIMSIGGMPE